jgi:hypothetical protein
MTAWQQVDATGPKAASPGPVIWLAGIAVVFFMVGLLAIVGFLALRAAGPLHVPPPQVAGVQTALVGPDMQVVVVELREEIVLDGAALTLENGETVEAATPLGERVSAIAFFVPLYGPPVVLDEVYVARKNGPTFTHKFEEGRR